MCFSPRHGDLSTFIREYGWNKETAELYLDLVHSGKGQQRKTCLPHGLQRARPGMLHLFMIPESTKETCETCGSPASCIWWEGT